MLYKRIFLINKYSGRFLRKIPLLQKFLYLKAYTPFSPSFEIHQPTLMAYNSQRKIKLFMLPLSHFFVIPLSITWTHNISPCLEVDFSLRCEILHSNYVPDFFTSSSLFAIPLSLFSTHILYTKSVDDLRL